MIIQKRNELEAIKAIRSNLQKALSPEEFTKILSEYLELQTVYSAAMKEIETKLEILDSEFRYRYKRNPIHRIQTRLKTPRSIANKLMRKGITEGLEQNKIRDAIKDIAGIRVICQYIDDIYTIAELLTRQDDLTVVKISDYIKQPKENGYRSYHMILNVPVFFAETTEHVNVEVQIRTIAMDCWASLEHELKYKNPEDVPTEIKARLLECAEEIAETDAKMQDIYKTLYVLESNGEEDE